ncbi:hypothetical protein F2Q70_00022412 [Brassica cretica]|uniref:Uncharacterized protein n=1 Tax=Brassica cretica TaxID=69181 RepID=A0A8S9GWA7_BRACR|nr:hypothetical protein F2Q70_00022412 [Brassica cretica]
MFLILDDLRFQFVSRCSSRADVSGSNHGAQMGVIGLIMRCEHIFPMIGIANPPAGSRAPKLAAIGNRSVQLRSCI